MVREWGIKMESQPGIKDLEYISGATRESLKTRAFSLFTLSLSHTHTHSFSLSLSLSLSYFLSAFSSGHWCMRACVRACLSFDPMEVTSVVIHFFPHFFFFFNDRHSLCQRTAVTLKSSDESRRAFCQLNSVLPSRPRLVLPACFAAGAR